MNLETKFAQIRPTITEGESTLIEGYASVFGVTDGGGDQVQKGAYAKSLSNLATEGRAVKMLWQHDPTQPIGIWEEVREDDRGLFVRGRILADVEKGREALSLVRAGAIDGLSIGYRTKSARKGADGARILSEIDLWEVSLVTFPMLANARIAAKFDTQTYFKTLAAAFDDARRAMT